jgi:GNAT superfamily N-acetyltransferase
MISIQTIPDDYRDWELLLSLIMTSFAFMDGVIDPPSSAHRLTPEDLAQKARDETGFLAFSEGALVGCVFCKVEHPDCLYIGKLAVLPELQGRGIGKKLMQAAEAHALDLGLRRLRLDVRIELTGNHAAFSALGFVKTADRRHPGYDRTTQIEMQKQLSAVSG